MNLHKLDIAALLSSLVGISSLATDAAFQTALAPLLGGNAHEVLAVLGLIGIVSSQVLRTIGAPSGTVLVTPTAPLVVPSVAGVHIVANTAPPAPGKRVEV